MDKERNSNNSYVFGLDIGTRSVVGVVGYLEYGRFKIAAMAQQLVSKADKKDKGNEAG